MDGRHEIKHYINMEDYILLRSRLRLIAKPDENAAADGGYLVRSLYFDNYADKAVVEKLAGLSKREKFRIRYYNGDVSFIRVEKKSKSNRLTYKESALITKEQCAAVINGKYDCLKSQPTQPTQLLQPTPPAQLAPPGEPETQPGLQNNLLMELYTKIRYQNLRPRSIVDYRREAYVYKAGNVRVTFDSNIRTSNSVSGFLNPKLPTIPAANAIILEVKYDGFLPGVIRDILQIGWRSDTEFSKYVAARLA